MTILKLNKILDDHGLYTFILPNGIQCTDCHGIPYAYITINAAGINVDEHGENTHYSSIYEWLNY